MHLVFLENAPFGPLLRLSSLAVVAPMNGVAHRGHGDGDCSDE